MTAVDRLTDEQTRALHALAGPASDGHVGHVTTYEAGEESARTRIRAFLAGHDPASGLRHWLAFMPAQNSWDRSEHHSRGYADVQDRARRVLAGHPTEIRELLDDAPKASALTNEQVRAFRFLAAPGAIDGAWSMGWVRAARALREHLDAPDPAAAIRRWIADGPGEDSDELGYQAVQDHARPILAGDEDVIRDILDCEPAAPHTDTTRLRAAAALIRNDAPHWHPVAAWLDATAAEADHHAAAGMGNCPTEVTQPHPLAVADAYLKRERAAPAGTPAAVRSAVRDLIAAVRAVPVECTALTGPVWYGEGWTDAVNHLEETADAWPDDSDDQRDVTVEFVVECRIGTRWVEWIMPRRTFDDAMAVAQRCSKEAPWRWFQVREVRRSDRVVWPLDGTDGETTPEIPADTRSSAALAASPTDRGAQ